MKSIFYANFERPRKFSTKIILFVHSLFAFLSWAYDLRITIRLSAYVIVRFGQRISGCVKDVRSLREVITGSSRSGSVYEEVRMALTGSRGSFTDLS